MKTKIAKCPDMIVRRSKGGTRDSHQTHRIRKERMMRIWNSSHELLTYITWGCGREFLSSIDLICYEDEGRSTLIVRPLQIQLADAVPRDKLKLMLILTGSL